MLSVIVPSVLGMLCLVSYASYAMEYIRKHHDIGGYMIGMAAFGISVYMSWLLVSSMANELAIRG